MKSPNHILKGAVAALFLLLPSKAPAISSIAEGDAIVWTAQAFSTATAIDVSQLDRLSFQAVYSSATIASVTAANGSKSAALITVTDFNLLDGRPSTMTITLTNNTNTAAAIGGAVITIQGRRYVEGVDWNRLQTSTMTMASLKDAIDAHSEYIGSVSSNVVTVTAFQNGTFANAWTITSSTPAALSLGGSTFSGGQAAGYININGTTLTEGTHFNAETSNGQTAENLETAINANATLLEIVIATRPQATGGLLYASATVSGINPYYVSVPASAGISATNFTGGAASDVSITNDTVTETSHGFATGLALLFPNEATVTAPTGLTKGTTYYAIKIDANRFKLASSAANALLGTAIDLTASAASGDVIFRPLAFAVGTSSFKWQASNDGTNWADLSVSSVTLVQINAGGTSVWDFADYAYKYIRANFIAPTTGAVALTIRLFGKVRN